MRRAGPVIILLIGLVMIIVFDPAGVPHAGAQQDSFLSDASKFSPGLEGRLVALPDGEMVTVVVLLAEQADLSGIRGPDHGGRLQTVIETLQALASRTQAGLRSIVERRAAQGQVAGVTYLWILNGFTLTAGADVLYELAARPDVATIRLEEPVLPADAFSQSSNSFFAPNLVTINAPRLWKAGYWGQNVVVASMDSGVSLSHPDLVLQWRGGTNSWFDPYGEHPLVPTDRSGHGTWTMGVMVGRYGSGQAIGVAPAAQWIAAKIFNDRGLATETAIHQGYQWLLDPDGNPSTPDAPQVVNNSWSLATPGCNLTFQPDLRALRAGGIIPVFSAGNAGPEPGTSLSPANNPEALAVGAVDGYDAVALDSSRGPSACDGRIFPDLVAPGVDILTTDLYGMYVETSGTSVAAPHVAGALALLLSADPSISPERQVAALLSAAVDVGPAGADNDTGYGRLDAWAAYQWLLANPAPVHVYFLPLVMQR